MDLFTRLHVVLVISLLSEQAFSRKTNLDPFPLGTIGCLVSDVCDQDETCENDFLFGSCQSVFSQPGDGNEFHLQTAHIELLDTEIQRLIATGFTWRDAYTQCVLQNTLVGFANDRSFDHFLCEDALGVASSDWSTEVNDEIASALASLLEQARVPPDQEEAKYMPNYNTNTDNFDFSSDNRKRDEIVQVHKYFDKSKGLFKRDPYADQYRVRFPSNDLFDNIFSSSRKQNPYNMYNPQSLSWNQDPEPMSYMDAYPRLAEGNDDDTGRLLQLNEQGQSLREALRDSLARQSYLPYTTVSSELEDTTQNDSDNILEISDEDEEALEGLLAGTISISDVEPSQQARIQSIVQTLIEALDYSDPDLAIDGVTTGDYPDTLDVDAKDYSDFLDPDYNSLDYPSDAALTPNDDDVDDAGTSFTSEDMMTTGEADDDDNDGDDDDEEAEVLADALSRSSSDEALSNVMGSSDFPYEGSQMKTLAEKMAAKAKKTVVDGGSEDDEAENDEEDADTPDDDKPADLVDMSKFWMILDKEVDETRGQEMLDTLAAAQGLPRDLLSVTNVAGSTLEGEVNQAVQDSHPNCTSTEDDKQDLCAAKTILDKAVNKVFDGLEIKQAGPGLLVEGAPRVSVSGDKNHLVLTFVLCGGIAGVVLATVTIYLIKRHHRLRQKLTAVGGGHSTGLDQEEASKDYQDLCRQRMAGKTSEKPEPLHAAQRIGSVSEAQVRSPSSRSSTSSWSEEPAATNMDISTGHIVLSYMEDHLKNQDRLDKEWEAVSSYVAEPCSTEVALDPGNIRKNRFADVMPYDHSRVILSSNANVANSDYINSSFITDHDPRNPAYICSQGPLPHTVADFWQMVWEQGSVVIVMLTKLQENGTHLCHRYWPEEGSDLYHIYEVHLVSEHIWCDDYLVRSFYLKNLQTNETRTVTQFHFLTWPSHSVPASIKALLDFRRKVNKSFRGRSCPIVVHCSDGCGRSGTYCLIDMVLNKMAKGAKEIDMAATLEHIRDQRMSVVATKEQFQFSLAAVAEEVHAILKALPQ